MMMTMRFSDSNILLSVDADDKLMIMMVILRDSR